MPLYLQATKKQLFLEKRVCFCFVFLTFFLETLPRVGLNCQSCSDKLQRITQLPAKKKEKEKNPIMMMSYFVMMTSSSALLTMSAVSPATPPARTLSAAFSSFRVPLANQVLTRNFPKKEEKLTKARNVFCSSYSSSLS